MKETVDTTTVCVHHLLEEQALRRPHATAVEFEGRRLTFSELHSRANQLAHLLCSKGVGADDLVGVSIERSLEMVVALLGVLKAGGAYVPLDPSYGSGRIQYVLNEAQVKALITQEELLSTLPPISAEIVCLDPDWSALAHQSAEPLATLSNPSSLAYVIYTSGSTGKPKGVQLEHRSVVNFLCSMRQEPGLHSKDVLVAVTTLSFDIAGLEMFLPLLVGARLVVASRQTTQDGNLLIRLLRDSGATVLQATPATWRLLFECDWKGDRNLKVLVGGEALSPELARRLVSSCGEVWNMYGPTETTIWSSVYRVHGREERSVPIGKPIANTTLYILDANQQPVPASSEGELYIAGEGLARGYFKRPEITAEKFVPDPFSSRPDARMYRTGDLARFGPDGDVEFLGRLDHQVKIRGFRIELGEIEAVLEEHSSVQQAVVVAREEASGDKALVAYFIAVAGQETTIAGLRGHLRRQLPEYMIPAAFVQLNELPLTQNGKVDRKALPAPTLADYKTVREYVAPRDRVERKLAALWEEALSVRPVGANDNFFELGGTSLRAARLFMGISRKFGKELPLSTLLRADTVELLANEIRPAAKKTRHPTLVALRQSGSKPPFFVAVAGGDMLFLQPLAARMSNRPIYGLLPDGLDGMRMRHQTVEQFAADYLSEIRKIQPTGPYYLGGYCFGGLVAFEMAQELLSQGEKAAAVVMLSAPIEHPHWSYPPTVPETPSRSLFGRFGRLILTPWRILRLRWPEHRLIFALGLRMPPEKRTEYIGRMLYEAEHLYTPKPYPGTLICFHGSNLTEFGPDLGWGSFATRLEHHVIGDGDFLHRRDLFYEPLVEQTARELNACLDAAIGSEVAAEQKNTEEHTYSGAARLLANS